MKQLQVGGYVLAGGRSTRMGRDKALLELAGKPLIQRALETLSQVCNNVHILSSRQELSAFAPLIPDVHQDCGPLGGMEAALLHTPCPWILLLAVDMPFIPVNFLDIWVQDVIARKNTRIALFTVAGRPQPTLCLLHRDLLPFLQQAIQRQEFKLFRVLEEAAQKLSYQEAIAIDQVMMIRPSPVESWFTNLNTPEEFDKTIRQLGLPEQDL